MSTTTDGGSSYVVFRENPNVVTSHLRIGKRSPTGTFTAGRRVVLADRAEIYAASVIARDGHWWLVTAHFDMKGIEGTGNLYLTTDTAGTHAIAEAVPPLVSVSAAWTPTGQGVALATSSWDRMSDGDGGFIFARGGAAGAWSQAFAPFNGARPRLVARYGRTYAAWQSPSQVQVAHHNGSGWSAPIRSAVLATAGPASGLEQAVSLGSQLVGWSDRAGLHLARRSVTSGGFTPVLHSRAGAPVLGALTAVDGRATVIYTVTFPNGSMELRALSQ